MQIAELLLLNGANAQQSHFLGHEINLVPMENVECLKVLLRHGADVNSLSRSGLTPLMKASKEGWVRAHWGTRWVGTWAVMYTKPAVTDRQINKHFRKRSLRGLFCVFLSVDLLQD